MRRIEKTQHAFFRFITRPLTGFLFYLAVVAFVLFVPRNGPIVFLFHLVIPWLLLAGVALNLSFISGVFRRFTLSDSVKKNHALEHGTIFFLRRHCGGRARIGGSAQSDGFRICGVQKKELVLQAFDELLEELRRGGSEHIVSMRCGSNIATAQGLGVLLLSFTAVGLLALQASPMACTAALSVDVLVYLLLRTRLGNWVQGRFFMSLEFANARIQSIYRVEKQKFWEINPVFFVKTAIS